MKFHQAHSSTVIQSQLPKCALPSDPITVHPLIIYPQDSSGQLSRLRGPFQSMYIFFAQSQYELTAVHQWVFTIGLALSSAVDILIAVFLCYSLQNSRSASSSMDHVINLLILYTFENGALTWSVLFISLSLRGPYLEQCCHNHFYALRKRNRLPHLPHRLIIFIVADHAG